MRRRRRSEVQRPAAEQPEVVDVDAEAAARERGHRPEVVDVDGTSSSSSSVDVDLNVASVASIKPPCPSPAVPLTVDGLPLEVRIPVDPAAPHRGWVMRGKLPVSSGLALAAPGSAPLRLLLDIRPAELGKIVMFGKLTDTPRYHQAVGKDYHFTGVRHSSAAYPPCVEELQRWANDRRGDWEPHAAKATTNDVPCFNSGLINWYMSGNHYMGPHCDDERSLHPGSPIFSFTVGQTRVFRIREVGTGKIVRDIDLRSGEWLVMGGAMQTYFKHEVVKVNGDKGARMGPRVNITFRQMV